MHTSKTVYSFEMEREPKHGFITLTAQQYPWSVLQVIPVEPPLTFEEVVAKCKKRGGFVVTHDTDHTFCIIHLCSGDQDGKYPERDFKICGQRDADRYLDALEDCMAQAAVWYHTNVVLGHSNTH